MSASNPDPNKDEDTIDISGKLIPEEKQERGPWLTFEDRQEVRQIIFEQKMYGWTNLEAVEICKKRLSRPQGISFRTYENLKAKEADKNEVTEWVAIQAKAGFLENYKQVIEEMLFVKQRLLRKFDYETSKPLEEQNAHVVGSLSRNVREQLLALAALGVGSPILMQIKNLIDKGLANEFFNDNRLTEENRELTEDGGEDRYTTTSGTTDEYAA